MGGRALMGIVSSDIRYDPITGNFWRLFRDKSKLMGWERDDGYIQISIDGESMLAHVYAWYIMTGEWPTHEIDHENTKRNDNRWINLREATHTQNIYNRKVQRNNTSGVKGVSWHAQREKWRAYTSKDYKQFSHGLYDDIEEAVAAVREAQAKLHGEFVNFNS